MDDEGNPRELHLKKAMEVLDESGPKIGPFYGLPYEETGLRITALAAGRYFALERLEFPREWTGSVDGARFELMTVLKGRGSLQDENSNSVELGRGLTVLLAAGLGDYRIQEADGLVVLRSYCPDLEMDIIKPLKTRGFSAADISKLAGGKRPNDLSGYF